MRHHYSNHYRGEHASFRRRNQAQQLCPQRDMKSKRAPLENASHGLMEDVIEQTKKYTLQTNVSPNTIIMQRDDEHDKEQKELLTKTHENPLNIVSNIYALTFDKLLIITEWDIISSQTSEKLTDHKAIYQNKQNLATLRDHFIFNHFDYSSKCLLTAQRNNNNKQQNNVKLTINGTDYCLKQRNQFNMKQFSNIDDDAESKRSHIQQRQMQIYQKLIDQKFKSANMRSIFKIYFHPNSMERVQRIDNIDYIEGYKAAITHINRKPFIGIKIWSKYLFFDSVSVRDVLKNNGSKINLLGTKCIVMYSMRMITISEIDATKSENDKFTRDNKKISYKQYLCET